MKRNAKITKQPGKQRKKFYTAPLHQRRKQITAPLAPALAEKEGVKKLVIRKGDTVRVRKGSFRGIEGEVSNVDYKTMRIIVEGVTFEKTDGSAQHFPVRACNCEIIAVKNMRDDRRKAIVERRTPKIEGDEVEN